MTIKMTADDDSCSSYNSVSACGLNVRGTNADNDTDAFRIFVSICIH